MTPADRYTAIRCWVRSARDLRRAARRFCASGMAPDSPHVAAARYMARVDMDHARKLKAAS